MKATILVSMIFSFLLTQTILAKSSDDLNIAGGTNAIKDDAPFFVSFRDAQNEHYCAGSLIDPEWVLTAAHCLAESAPPEKLFADSLSMNFGKKTTVLEIDSVYIHPLYDSSMTSSDIALIKIKKYNNAKLIPINTDDVLNFYDNAINIVGLGATSDLGFLPDQLRKAQIKMVDKKICEQQLQSVIPSSNAYLDETMFCAGDVQGRKDTCSGDSGGPVFVTNQFTGDSILIGIVSWGFGCAHKDLSGVYTDVSFFKSWIETTILNQ